MLGGGDDVGVGGVDDHDPPPGGRLDVDVVEPDARPSDHDEVAARLEDLLGDVGLGADHEGVRPLDGLEQGFGGELELHVDRVPGVAHPGQPAIGQLLGDEDPCHRYPTDSFSSRPIRLRPSSICSSPKA